MALANAISPTVMIGKAGLSEGVLSAFAAEFEHRELVKLRFLGAEIDKRESCERLAQASGAELLRIIGNVAVFYKEAPERPIALPHGR